MSKKFLNISLHDLYKYWKSSASLMMSKLYSYFSLKLSYRFKRISMFQWALTSWEFFYHIIQKYLSQPMKFIHLTANCFKVVLLLFILFGKYMVEPFG